MATPPAPARPRPGGGRLFIIIGLVLAVLAVLGVIFLGTLGAAGGGGGGPKLQVLVAARDITYRTQLTKEDFTPQNMFASDLPATGYFQAKDSSSLVGTIAELNISKGQLITQNMLAKSSEGVLPQTSAYLPLPSGWVAYTMPTGEQVGVAGYPQVGDYITVIAQADSSLFETNRSSSSAQSKFIVKTVFANLRIIRLGVATGNVTQVSGTQATSNTPSGGLSSSITVELTQCDAEYMTWLLDKTQLKYTLISYHDYTPPPTAPDASCATIGAAKGVGPTQVNNRWHFSST